MSEGVFAIVGVILGGLFGWVGEYIRWNLSRRDRAHYLAVRIVISLDRFVDRCATAASINYEDREVFSAARPEKLVLPDDVDWQSVTPEIAYRILELPQKEKEANEKGIFYWDATGEADVAQSAEIEGYVKVGLDAAKIATQLRKRYRLPERPQKDWEPTVKLQEQWNRIVEKEKNTNA